MTADQRLTAAREYLGYARALKVADLPYPALMRMAAELRRQLGQVLDYVTEGEAAAGQADDELWQALLTEVSEMRDHMDRVLRIVLQLVRPGEPR